MKCNSPIYKLVFLTIALIWIVTLTNAQDAEKSCKDCHNSLVSLEIVHAPADESCETCHTSNENKHPQDGVTGFQLADEPTSLCFNCHEELSKVNKHAPAESGECISCHNPHSSNYLSLLTASTEKDLCLQCHEMEIPETNVVHSPVKKGKCSSCHDPHQSDETAFLKASKPDLCFTCHTQIKDLASASNKHAVFEDDCSNCHQSHSAPVKGLLSESEPTLCYNCHGDLKEQIDAAKVVHKVVTDEKTCSNCHSPHASNNTAMLLNSGNDLCLSCHNRTYTNDKRKIANIANKLKEGNSIHAPVEEACVNCHKPHASGFSFLLTNNFATGTYTAASVDNYALCFDCHDSELLTAENSTNTNFRHGDKNMHYLHLKGDKGKNCALCHDVHGAKNEHLISEKVPYGNWQMDLNFKVFDNGGSCATGCHAEKIYDRNFAIAEEKTATSEEPQNISNRYKSYDFQYHEVDSSVILANKALEEERLEKLDTMQQVLIAEQAQDSVQQTSSDSTLIEKSETLIAQADSLVEKDVIAEQTVQKDTVITNESEKAILAENTGTILDTISETKDILESKEPTDTALITSNEAVKENEVETKETENKLESETIEVTHEQMNEAKESELENAKIAESTTEHIAVETATEKEKVLEFKYPPIVFAFDSKTVGAEEEKIKDVVYWMKQNLSRSIELHGYTDNIGPEEYNDYLSLLRAKSVRDFMVGEGIQKKRIVIKGLGEKNPIAPNNSRDGRAKNRRVEFILVEEE